MGSYKIEAILIDTQGYLLPGTKSVLPIAGLSATANHYFDSTPKYSSNLEGLVMDKDGAIYVISDNKNGNCRCNTDATQKTLMLEIKR